MSKIGEREREREPSCLHAVVVRDDDVGHVSEKALHCALRRATPRYTRPCGLLGAKQVSWQQPLLRHRGSPSPPPPKGLRQENKRRKGGVKHVSAAPTGFVIRRGEFFFIYMTLSARVPRK